MKIIDTFPHQDGLSNILSQNDYNGGSPYNILKDLANMNASFPLAGIGLLGDDSNGRKILKDCSTHNINTNQLTLTKEHPTSFTDVMSVASDGRRTFFHQRGANAALAPKHFDFSQPYKIFHLGYLLLLDILDEIIEDKPVVCEVLEKAQKAGFKVSVDVVSESGDRFQKIVPPTLPFIDYFFANEYEAAKIIGRPTESVKNPTVAELTEMALEIKSLGVKDTVVLHHPKFCVAIDQKGNAHMQESLSIPKENIVGAVGAGDALVAGCLYGFHEDWPIQKTLELAVSAAASSLTAAGASDGLLSIEELLKLKEKWVVGVQ